MPLNSSKLLAYLHGCTCGQPCRTYVSMVLGGNEAATPPADLRLTRLNAAKLALYESIFLWEYYSGDEKYDDMAQVVHMANECGASLSDMIHPQRELRDEWCWEDSDWWLDVFEDSGVSKNALRMLCEANTAGATLPASVAAFMARHSMVHEAECAENIDNDQCFLYSESLHLSVDEKCELAALLRAWDIRSAFAGGGGGGGGGSSGSSGGGSSSAGAGP